MIIGFLLCTDCLSRGMIITSMQMDEGRSERLQESILELAELVRNGSVSPVELTTACLARIEKLNPILNAFITVTRDSALAQARQAEAEIHGGNWRGPLHGIPLGLKDLIDTRASALPPAARCSKTGSPPRMRKLFAA